MLQFHTFIVHIYICKVDSCTTDHIVYGCTQCVIAQVSATSLGFILGYVVRRLVIIINQVLRIIKIAVKSDVKTGRI